MLVRTAAFAGATAAGVIDQDVAHELRGDAKEVRAIFPVHVGAAR